MGSRLRQEVRSRTVTELERMTRGEASVGQAVAGVERAGGACALRQCRHRGLRRKPSRAADDHAVIHGESAVMTMVLPVARTCSKRRPGPSRADDDHAVHLWEIGRHDDGAAPSVELGARSAGRAVARRRRPRCEVIGGGYCHSSGAMRPARQGSVARRGDHSDRSSARQEVTLHFVACSAKRGTCCDFRPRRWCCC